MIVLAADYVGLKIVQFLAMRSARVDYLALDPADKGGFNGRIEDVARSRWPAVRVVESDLLTRSGFLEELARSRPAIGILAWWPRLLRGKLLSIPTRGWINLHPSYLPYNRGKHPNFWCLLEGTPCGVSLHYVDEGVDTGPIVAQESLAVTWEDTGETVYRRSREMAIDLFKRHFGDLVADRGARIPQPSGAGTSHRSEEIDVASRIDLDGEYTARRLLNVIRAKMFPPHPTAYFIDDGARYSVEVIIRKLSGRDEAPPDAGTRRNDG